MRLTIRKIRDEVTPDLARIKRELTALSHMEIHVGIQGDEDSEMLIIASVHEFGATIKMTDKMRRYLGAIGLFDSDEDYTPPAGHQKGYINIPERSFIRASYDTGKKGIDGVVRMAFDRIIKGEWSAEQAADNIGLFCVQMTQNFINTGSVKPPKGKFTQERSTQYTTLYDSGRLVGSITYKIEQR